MEDPKSRLSEVPSDGLGPSVGRSEPAGDLESPSDPPVTAVLPQAVAAPVREPESLEPPKSVSGEGKSRSVSRPVVAAVLLLAAVTVTALFVTYEAELWGGRRVPSVTGKSQVVAQRDLEQRGFEVVLAEGPVDDGVGKAVRCDPASGTRLERGSEVTLVVGTKRVLPDVVGMRLDEARAVLADAGVQDVSIQYEASSAEGGTVTRSTPEAGSAFVARDAITLTVAQPYTVPYVMGKNESEARSLVEAAGLEAKLEYVNSDEPGGSVVGVSPDQGTRVGRDDVVTLRVSEPYPSDYHHLAEYFEFTASQIGDYLQKQGFSLQASYANAHGKAQALYEGEGGRVTLGSYPFSAKFDLEAAREGANPEADAGFEGVRLELPKSEWPAEAGRLSHDALEEVMELCGLSGLSRSCNMQTVVLPQGQERKGAPFVCGYGEMGDACWTVLIVQGGKDARVVVTAAPKALYKSYDLAPFGGSVCDFVAYGDVYGKRGAEVG